MAINEVRFCYILARQPRQSVVIMRIVEMLNRREWPVELGPAPWDWPIKSVEYWIVAEKWLAEVVDDEDLDYDARRDAEASD